MSAEADLPQAHPVFYDIITEIQIFGTLSPPQPPMMVNITSEMRTNIMKRLKELKVPGLPPMTWDNFLISADDISYVRSYSESKCLEREAGTATYLCWMDRPVVIRVFQTEYYNVATVVKEAAMIRHLADMDSTPKLVGLVRLEESDTFLKYGMAMEYVRGPQCPGFENRLDRILSHDAKAHRNGTMAMLLSRKEWTKVLMELALAMRALHKRRLAHGRIQLSNIQLRRLGSGWEPCFVSYGNTVATLKASKFQNEIENFGILLQEMANALEFDFHRMADWCLGKYHDRPDQDAVLDFCRNSYYYAIDREKEFFQYTGQELHPIRVHIDYSKEPNPDWLEIARMP
jgi:hypothetical protein